MNTPSAIRKVYQGTADRHQMFRMFDRHAQRPNRFEGNASSLYAGEWFEITEREHDYMFEILPPLWIRGSMFAMREFLTGSVTRCSSRCGSTELFVTSMDIAISSTVGRWKPCGWRSSRGKRAL